MESSVVALARQAAAAARAERAAQEASMRPVPARKYRGVQTRRNRYRATIWNPERRMQLWLGSYATPEEAAYAYDAAARSIQGRWAKPNFPEPSSPVLTNLTLALRALRQVPSPARNTQLLRTPGLQARLLPWAPPAPSLPRFVRLPGPTAGAAPAPNGTGLYRAFPSIPGGYVPVTLEELRLNWPASSEQRSTEPAPSAEAVPKRRRLAVSPAMALEDGSVVGDNFSNNGGASSSVASTGGGEAQRY